MKKNLGQEKYGIAREVVLQALARPLYVGVEPPVLRLKGYLQSTDTTTLEVHSTGSMSGRKLLLDTLGTVR